MIKMIAGVFGLPVKQPGKKTRVVAKGPSDGPFSASPEQEARLVDLGLARYVDEPAEDAIVDDGGPIGFGEAPPDDYAPDAESAEDDVDEQEARPIEELNAKELRALGKEYGLTFKANAKKEDMIAQIKAAWPEPAEDAPAFDAAEAVL